RPEVVPEPLLQVAPGLHAGVAADRLGFAVAAEAALTGEVAQDRLVLEQRQAALLQPRHLAKLHLRLQRGPLGAAVHPSVLVGEALVFEEQPDRLAEPAKAEIGQDRNGHGSRGLLARRRGALPVY